MVMMDQIIHYLTSPLVGACVIALICLVVLFGILAMARKLWNDIQDARAQQGQTQAQPAPAVAPAQPTETSSRMGWNMWIAKTHEFATQVIGVQIAGANVLAIIVSVVSVVGGLVSLAAQQYPDVPVLWLAAGAVGLGVAVLIEGITISALIRIRNAGPAIRKAMAQWEKEFDEAKQRDANRYYSDKQYRRAMNRDFADRKKRLVKPHEKKRRDSVPFAFMGAVASATAGGLFYHTILSGLEMWLSFAISGLLAFVVTGTFVSQELFREDQEDAIKEGFKGGSLTLEAIKEEAKRISMQEIYSSLRTYMQSEEARTTINGKLLQMLTMALDDITDSTVAQFREAAQPKIEAQKQEIETQTSEVKTPDAQVVIEPETTAKEESYTPDHKPDDVQVIETEATPDKATVNEEDKASYNEQALADTLTALTQDEEPEAEELITDSINLAALASSELPSDLPQDIAEVAKNYPRVYFEWIAKEVKSVDIDAIVEVTGQPKRRVQYHAGKTFTRTPKNPKLYTVTSVIKWLRTAPSVSGSTDEMSAVIPTSNGNHNGHAQEVLSGDYVEMTV